MLDFMRALIHDRSFVTRLPTLIAAFLIAELFYKFHSFMLETGGFLLTWLVFDLIVERVFGRRAPTA